MSKIAFTPNASGTGTFTFAAPGTNTDRTLTLPDASGTLATTAELGGVTHLGTLATTSGTSVTLSGLTLTGYKFLQFQFEGVSTTSTTSFLRLNGYIVAALNPGTAADISFGGGIIDLSNGAFWCAAAAFTGTTFAGSNGYGGPSGLTTSSTSVTFTASANNFDAGSIRIYGVK
jgi:hypothetical protein